MEQPSRKCRDCGVNLDHYHHRPWCPEFARIVYERRCRDSLQPWPWIFLLTALSMALALALCARRLL